MQNKNQFHTCSKCFSFLDFFFSLILPDRLVSHTISIYSKLPTLRDEEIRKKNRAIGTLIWSMVQSVIALYSKWQWVSLICYEGAVTPDCAAVDPAAGAALRDPVAAAFLFFRFLLTTLPLPPPLPAPG